MTDENSNTSLSIPEILGGLFNRLSKTNEKKHGVSKETADEITIAKLQLAEQYESQGYEMGFFKDNNDGTTSFLKPDYNIEETDK